MNTLFTMLDGPWSALWSRWMIAMSWQVAVLVAALFALGWLLRRQSAQLRYGLWSLVLLRLVLPPTLALATGWAWWVLPVHEVPRTPLVEARLPEPSVPSHLVYPYRVGSHPFESSPSPAHTIDPPATAAAQPRTAQPSSPTPAPRWPWKAWLVCGWLLGTTVMAVRLLRGLWQVRRLVRSSVSLEESELNQLLRDCCKRVGVHDVPDLHESPLIETPLLIGYWRPTILVPLQIQEQLSPAELESVLIHELHHVRRHDAAVSLLQAVLKAIYFFHPAVWLADRWLRRLREEACDEATVGVLAGHRRDYGSAILKLAEQTLRPASPMAIGVVESGSHITHRMRRILDPQLPTGRTLSWSALALVLIAAATLLPAGPQQKVATQDPQEADAGIKPVEFCIVPTTLPSDETQIRWFPIRQKPPSDKDAGLASLGIVHARQVDGRWEAAVWDVPEHALLASDKWHVVHCDAKPDADNPMFWTMTITLDEQGGNAFRTLSLQHHKQRLAIIVNGEIITAPTINGEIGNSLQITGAFSKESAQALADAISQPAKKPEVKAPPEKAATVAPAETTPDSTPKPEPPEPQATVRGVVVDTEGKPAAGARVVASLWKGGTMEVVADSAGRFEVTADRKYLRGHMLRAYAEGGQLQAALMLPWEEKELGRADLKLELTPARRAELHVVDQDGQPVAGANCGVMGAIDLDFVQSDGNGHAVFLIPSSIPIEYAYAYKGGVGFDYRAYVLPREQRFGDLQAKAPEFPKEPLQLTLEGVSPVKVRVVEPGGIPVVGMQLWPWLLKKPDQSDDLNLSYFAERVTGTTDASGEAMFDWIPKWQEQSLQLWPVSEEYTHQRGSYDPKTGDGTLTMTLDRLVPIRGKAILADGSPAVGIEISASGESYQFDGFRGNTKTDAEGRYELKVAPNMIYLVIAQGEKLAAIPETGFAVWPGQPIDNLNFTLRPATRLFGRVTEGAEKTPVKQFQITVYQYGLDSLVLEEIKLPNPEGSRKYVRPTLFHHATTDDTGHYEMFVGRGQFDMRGPSQNEIPKFEITDESEREFNFDAPRPETGTLDGLVETLDNTPVAGAVITCVYRHDYPRVSPKAVTDAEGLFKITRGLHRMVLHAASADGQLAGIAEIDADDDSAVITVGPLASATGRLLDAAGKPLPGEEIQHSVRVPQGDDDAPWQDSFGGKTTTDSNGQFELKSLVVGQKYDVTWTTRTGPGESDYQMRTIKDITPPSVEPVDLGDIQLPADQYPAKPQPPAPAAETPVQGSTVPIRGRVTLPDGSPAEGVNVKALGSGYSLDGFFGQTKTDPEGRYEIPAAPGKVYLVLAEGEKLAAAAHTGFAVWPGQPIENLDFALRPATRLFGRVTVGPEKKPAKQVPVYVHQRGTDARDLKGKALPNPDNSSKWVQPFTNNSVNTNDNGEFEMWVGGGQFEIYGTSQNPSQKFEITTEPEKEFNFHAPRAETGTLEGLVENAENDPVADAIVTGFYQHNSSGHFEAVTNPEGIFKVERKLHSTVLHAISADGQLAGMIEIGPDDEATVIPIGPLALATGNLLDESGKPFSGKEISYGVKVHAGDDKAPFLLRCGGKTTTDQTGHFELKSLIVGQQYDIDVGVQTGSGPEDHYTHVAGQVTPENAATINLGDLKLPFQSSTDQTQPPAPEPPVQGSTGPAKAGQGVVTGRVLPDDTQQPMANGEPDQTPEAKAPSAMAAADRPVVPATEARQPPPLPAPRMATVRVTVLDEHGAPAPGVELHSPLLLKPYQPTVTDARGQFEITWPQSEFFRKPIHVRSPDRLQQAQSDVKVKEDHPETTVVEVTLKLEPAQRAEVTVLDATGQPLAGALVGISGSERGEYQSSGYVGEQTGVDGKAVLMFPKVWLHGSVFSLMSGHGVDYRVYNSFTTQATAEGKNPVLRDLAAVQLQLEGAKPIRFRVTDWKDVPIAGTRIAAPFLIRLDREAEPLAFNGRVPFEIDHVDTDANGLATLDWFPVWCKQPVTFVSGKLSSEFIPVSVYDLPPEPDGTYWIRQSRYVPVRGTVRKPDGTAMSGIQVDVQKYSYGSQGLFFGKLPDGLDGQRELDRLVQYKERQITPYTRPAQAITDSEGKYELWLAPQPEYAVVAHGPGWASSIRDDLETWEGVPVENFDLTVLPATIVTGRISLDGKAVSHSENGMVQYLSDPKLPPIAKTTSRPLPPSPPHVFFHKFTTDSDGRYRIELGPGYYRMNRHSGRIKTNFELTDQREFRLDFEAKTSE